MTNVSCYIGEWMVGGRELNAFGHCKKTKAKGKPKQIAFSRREQQHNGSNSNNNVLSIE